MIDVTGLRLAISDADEN